MRIIFRTDGYKGLTTVLLAQILFVLFNHFQNHMKQPALLCVFDFGKSYYRMDMHKKNTKGTRKKPQDEEEIKKYEEFFAVLNDLPEQLDEEVLKFRGVEADDILAWITQYVSDKYDHTWIISSDRDLYQLVDENISIFNIFGRREVTIQSLRDDFDVSPSEYMLSRIIEVINLIIS